MRIRTATVLVALSFNPQWKHTTDQLLSFTGLSRKELRDSLLELQQLGLVTVSGTAEVVYFHQTPIADAKMREIGEVYNISIHLITSQGDEPFITSRLVLSAKPEYESGSFAKVLPALLEGEQIRRKWRPQDHYELDAADGLTIWKYDGDNDELIRDWKFDVHELVAADWEVVPNG